MPVHGEAGDNSILRRSASTGLGRKEPGEVSLGRNASLDFRRKEPGEAAEGRIGQLMESNGLKNTGLFGFVHYFMDRPESSSQISGASSPKTMPVSVSTTPTGTSPIVSTTPISPSTVDNSSSSPLPPEGESSSSPTTGPELVKNEVFSDLEKSGPLHSQSQRRIESQQVQTTRTYLKSEEYRQLFHLPPEEILIEDFNCALQKKILLQGHMYLFEQYVCFYSNIFGYEKKKVIPLKDITCVRKAKTAGVFPNAIEITGWGKKHFFASFLSRDEAYRLIINGWSHHSGYARKFLGANFSPTSSPPSQGRVSLDSTIMSLGWRSPQRVASVQPEDMFSPSFMVFERGIEAVRLDQAHYAIPLEGDTEDVPNLVAPSPMEEVAIIEGPEEPSDRADIDDSVEGASEERVSLTDSTSVSTATLWEPEDLDAPVLPEGYKTVVESEFAVDVEEFFQLFFSDDANDFTKRFHAKCGDDEFRCTQWAKHRHFGQARDISFRHPIKFYFGPKSTYCHESQRFRVYRNSHLVLETSQQMTDIPYGDYFRVEVRWDVERLYGRGSAHSFVRISLGVSFCKKTFWKGKIEQGTHEESKDAYTTWIREAHAMLQDARSVGVDVITAQNSTAPSSPGAEVEETIREVTNPLADGEILTEGEPSARRLHEIERSTKADEAVRSSELRAGVHGGDWSKKGSAVLGSVLLVSNKIWEKGYNLDFKPNKQLKLMCFMLIAIVVVLMQIGIIIVLARTPKVEYVPVGYQNSQASSGSCGVGGSTGDDILAWFEQRARNVKEEILLAEARIQTLHQDLVILKMHASNLLAYVVDNQSSREQTPVE